MTTIDGERPQPQHIQSAAHDEALNGTGAIPPAEAQTAPAEPVVLAADSMEEMPEEPAAWSRPAFAHPSIAASQQMTSSSRPFLAGPSSQLAMQAKHSHRWPLRLALAAAIAAAAGAAVAGFLAWENKDRAEAWRSRARAEAAVSAELRTLIGERTAELNERTRTLNSLAAKLRQTRAALARSARDVSQLAARQRELANEKAQIEDERQALRLSRDSLRLDRDALRSDRDALESVAASFASCNAGLFGLLNALIDDDYGYLSRNGRRVIDDCKTADASLDEYLAAHR
jgi:hypothetical protein